MTESQEHTIRTAIIKLNLAVLELNSDHKEQAIDKINEAICMLSRMQTIT